MTEPSPNHWYVILIWSHDSLSQSNIHHSIVFYLTLLSYSMMVYHALNSIIKHTLSCSTLHDCITSTPLSIRLAHYITDRVWYVVVCYALTANSHLGVFVSCIRLGGKRCANGFLGGESFVLLHVNKTSSFHLKRVSILCGLGSGGTSYFP